MYQEYEKRYKTHRFYMNEMNSDTINPIDAWIDAIPEDKYALCPCGCGKKFKFAIQEGIEPHEQRFIDNLHTCP